MYNATDALGGPDGGVFWYRVLRRNETPRHLRCPPAALSQKIRGELRTLIIRAIERGNVMPSPFLH
eukprot:6120701-Lingulodinium_polyedra.AAC.1